MNEKNYKLIGGDIIKLVNRSAAKVRDLKAELRPLLDTSQLKAAASKGVRGLKKVTKAAAARVKSRRLPKKLPVTLKVAVKASKRTAKSAAAQAAKLAAKQEARLRRDTLQMLLNWALAFLMIVFLVVLYFAYNK